MLFIKKGSILRYSTLFSQCISMRLRKKILSLAIIVFGLGGFWSFLGVSVASPVYAQTKTETTTTPVSSMEDNFRNLADIFLKVAYVILWPLIMLSGLALDNTMVYGEIFHMDAPLRQFWNLCKNFANFGLWFMILYEIIKSVLTLAWASKPMDTIKKAAIAGILIQMSWFIVAALIDVSTIATYAVWGMPMSIMTTDATMKNMKILQPDVSMNLNSEKKIESKDFIISYQVKTQEGTNILISPCEVKEHNKQSYIVGRVYGDEKFKNQGKLGLDKDKKPIDPGINACVYLNEVKFFYEFPDLTTLTGQAYKTKLTETLDYDERNWREACGYIIKLWDSEKTTQTCAAQTFPSVALAQTKNQWDPNWKQPLRSTDRPAAGLSIWANDWAIRFKGSAATSIGNLIDKSKWFVGPLATIYTSMMDFANLTDTSNANGSMGKGIGELIIRTGVAAGLLFPLLALTIVLMIRIWFLRCIIGASPLIILIKVFDLWGKTWDIGKHIDIKNILSAIFAPVITVFALSMGLIFMSALQSTYKTGWTENQSVLHDGLSAMGIEQTKGTDWDTYDTMNIFGLVLRYPKSMNTYAGATGDWFSWMIICFSGIWIMRFILFAAIQASWTIGEVWEKIKDFGENAISTAPILSTPRGNAGIKTVSDNFNPLSANGNARGNATTLRNNSKFVDARGQEERIGKVISWLDASEAKDTTKVVEMLKLNDERNYKEAGTMLAGGKEKKWDEMMSIIWTNADIESFIKNMTNKEKQKKLLSEWGITQQRETKEKRETATQNFEALVKDKPKDKGELEQIIKKSEAIDLAKVNGDYTKDVKTGDGKEYTITVKNNTFEIWNK